MPVPLTGPCLPTSPHPNVVSKKPLRFAAYRSFWMLQKCQSSFQPILTRQRSVIHCS